MAPTETTSSRGPAVDEVVGRDGRPAMGFNLEGMGLGAAAMLHLLLLAIFVTVFFWMPKFGPAHNFTTNMTYFARNTGYTINASLQEACKQGATTASAESLKDSLNTYLQQVEARDEAIATKNNRKLLIISCVSLAVIFAIMIIVIIIAKARHHRVDWGRMVAYCFGVFVLFCAFELALYFVVIRNYQPMSNAQMGSSFLGQLREQLLAMQQRPGGYSPPQESAGLRMPDLFHPVMVYALSNLQNLGVPLRQLNSFMTTLSSDMA